MQIGSWPKHTARFAGRLKARQLFIDSWTKLLETGDKTIFLAEFLTALMASVRHSHADWPVTNPLASNFPRRMHASSRRGRRTRIFPFHFPFFYFAHIETINLKETTTQINNIGARFFALSYFLQNRRNHSQENGDSKQQHWSKTF